MSDLSNKDFHYWKKLGKTGDFFFKYINNKDIYDNTCDDPKQPDCISVNGTKIEVKTCYSQYAKIENGIQKYVIIHNRYNRNKPRTGKNVCGFERAHREGCRFFVKQYRNRKCPNQVDIYDMNVLVPLLRNIIKRKRADKTLIVKSRLVTTAWNEFFLIERKLLLPAKVTK